MHIEQIYTGCLAQGAYYIQSENEAAIIDPLRESQPYLARAAKDNVTIKYIFETHFHADFVSGHLDLAQKTGAQIVYGPKAETNYDKYTACDGEIFKLGRISIKVLHTPGHTPESSCFLLLDENEQPHAIFTGDTLFIGDVGRPDLAQENAGLTQDELAGWLYDSLRHKIMPLPDTVLVYPAHGAGSACGKNMSKETWSTLGVQKATNYALRADMSKTEFIREVTEGLMSPPKYFSANAQMNKSGYESIDTVMQRGTKAMSPRAFETAANATGAIMLDVRDKTVFVKGFIPNAVFIGLDGSFAPWVGALLPSLQHPLLIIAPQGREEETVRRLARIGCDNVLGYLAGGFEAWQAAGREIDSIATIDTEQFATRLGQQPLQVLDVRKPGEFEREHMVDAVNFPLDFISNAPMTIDRTTTYYLHCRSGYRSTVAASILKGRGYEHLVNVQDRYDTFAAKGISVTKFVCPSTL